MDHLYVNPNDSPLLVVSIIWAIQYTCLREKQTAKPVKNVLHHFWKKPQNVNERSALVFKRYLTWNDRDSFQSSENSECSQRWDIPKVHKLCHISVIREVTHKHDDKTQNNYNRKYVTGPNQHLTSTAGHLTWNYRYSFQSSQNSESAQCWNIA